MKEYGFKCQKCSSRRIIARMNYPHGRRSKGRRTRLCKDCRSLEVKNYEK